jgi:mannose/fructose-specific phosphotransferase system component IIA
MVGKWEEYESSSGAYMHVYLVDIFGGQQSNAVVRLSRRKKSLDWTLKY